MILTLNLLTFGSELGRWRLVQDLPQVSSIGQGVDGKFNTMILKECPPALCGALAPRISACFAWTSHWCRCTDPLQFLWPLWFDACKDVQRSHRTGLCRWCFLKQTEFDARPRRKPLWATWKHVYAHVYVIMYMYMICICICICIRICICIYI